MPTESNVTSDNPEWNLAIKSREKKADYYFQTVLQNQREWYSKKAGKQKNWHLFYAIAIIVLGAAISCLQVIQTTDLLIKYVTAFLGAAVSVLRGLDTLLHPGETWQGYRKASEGMKREYRLYTNNADAYKNTTDEAAAYSLLVERVETILAEEQKLFWQSQINNTKAKTVDH